MVRADRAEVLGRRRDRPLVLVNLPGLSDDWVKLVTLARELEWDLLDPRYGGGRMDDLIPQGAIVETLPTDPQTRRLLKQGCHVVRIGTAPHPRDHLVPAVMHDQAAAGRMAADHFFERGFKHVGYVGFSPWSAKRELYEGLKARAAELEMRCHLLQWQSGVYDSPAEKYRVRQRLFAEWLREVPRPLGLLGFVDGHAAMLCRMCEDAGVAVPDEVSVLGNANLLPASEGSRPTLSSIELNEDAKVIAAVDLLRKLMSGEALEETTIQIPPKRIVVRESTDMLAVKDRTVAQALRFMWDHLDLDIGIDNVASEVGLSRRHLTRRFRVALGRTVNAEMRRKRLAEVRRLLRETDHDIAEITRRVGFHSRQYLHRAFKSAFGLTPLEFRKQG